MNNIDQNGNSHVRDVQKRFSSYGIASLSDFMLVLYHALPTLPIGFIRFALKKNADGKISIPKFHFFITSGRSLFEIETAKISFSISGRIKGRTHHVSAVAMPIGSFALA